MKRRPPRKGEQTLKEWTDAEATRLGIKWISVRQRLLRGGYPNVRVRTVNQRVKFVRVLKGRAKA